MIARIIFGEQDETINAGTSYFVDPNLGKQFLNVIYLRDFEFERSTRQKETVEETDGRGVPRLITRTSIEKASFRQILNANLLDLYDSIDNCSYKRLEIFESISSPTPSETFVLDRVEIEDNADVQRTTGQVIITFSLHPEFSNLCGQKDLQILTDALAYWDNNNDGSPDIDGNALRLGNFYSYQLYFESDGVTPLTSGDVELFVEGEDLSGNIYNLGTFNGVFGDNFNDPAKWTSFYNLWDYFDASNIVGNTERVDFIKSDFAEDFNFKGNETLDNALEIRFFLSVDNSVAGKTTLQRIYSTLTSLPYVTANRPEFIEEAAIINKTFERIDIASYEEISEILAGSTQTYTNFSIYSTDSLAIRYSVDRNLTFGINGAQAAQTITGQTLHGLDFTLKKGFYLGTNAVPINRDTGIVAQRNVGVTQVSGFLSDITTQTVTIPYTVLDELGGAYGSPNATGSWLFDGVLQSTTLDTSVGNHTLTLPLLGPTTTTHTVTIKGITDNSYELLLEFQIKLIAKF